MTRPADPWASLRRHTSARIALGRAGGSLPTAAMLDFALAHAAARDAVYAELDVTELRQDLEPLGLAIHVLSTQAIDRDTYLKRPDLGRLLSHESQRMLASLPPMSHDVAIIVSDGLSAPAAQHQAAPLLAALVPQLGRLGLILAPLMILRQARVAVQDPIGLALQARVAIHLIGERPGLGSDQSLGAYLVFEPRPGRTDAQRNCVSNIRPGGLDPHAAAETLCYLVTESLRLKLSGVALKDDRPRGLPSPGQGLSLS